MAGPRLSAFRTEGRRPILAFSPALCLPSGESDIFNTAQQLPMLSFPWQTFSMLDNLPVKKILPWISSKSPSMYIVVTTSCPGSEEQLLAYLVYCSMAYGCHLCHLLSVHVHLPLKASEQKSTAHSKARLRK